MDYKNFVYRTDAFGGFVELRKAINEIMENPKTTKKKVQDIFAEVGSLALAGNPIAQDMMSYYYKTGVPDVMPENYDQYMRWEILAGANGNEFAIEKLQFFLNYAFTEVISSEKLEQILARNDIDEKNYIYIIGNLLCEGIVDELKITAKGLVEAKEEEVKYTPEKLRTYKRVLEKVVPKILEYLLA